MSENTNFGFKAVSFDEKRNLIGNLFSKISDKYDIMNDLMSIGLHRAWKEQFCGQISNFNSRILDVASGTGDIALKLKAKANNARQNLRIVISDLNPEMLELARRKAIAAGFWDDSMEYVVADAQKLPFEDNSFDYYTISFGIRNVPNIPKALEEARRVLKPMGKFLCMEFSHPTHAAAKKLYDAYLFNLVPKLGKLFAKNEDAYQYLAESIAMFPDQDNFKSMIQDAGFGNVQYSNLNFGIVAIHTAYKF